jgi:hypothetical protein
MLGVERVFDSYAAPFNSNNGSESWAEWAGARDGEHTSASCSGLSHLADTQSQSSAQLHDKSFSGSFGARSHLKANAASRLLNAFAAESTAKMRAAIAGSGQEKQRAVAKHAGSGSRSPEAQTISQNKNFEKNVKKHSLSLSRIELKSPEPQSGALTIML